MKKIVMATLLMAMTSIASAQVVLSGKVSSTVDQTKVGDTKSTQLVNAPLGAFYLFLSLALTFSKT